VIPSLVGMKRSGKKPGAPAILTGDPTEPGDAQSGAGVAEPVEATTDSGTFPGLENIEETPTPYLVVIAGPLLGEVVAVPYGKTIVGRAPEIGIVLQDSAISRQHARLVRDELGSCSIVDLDSRNGTYVNGKKVGETPLQRGDRVQLGKNTIARFDYLGTLEGKFHTTLHEAGTRDALTGLANRGRLEQRLDEEFRGALQEKRELAVLMLDLDHFKEVNDTHGHAAGDAVLHSIAQVLKARLRRDDLVARYGGEEFVMLLPRTSSSGARKVAHSIRTAVESTPVAHQSATIATTVSIGVAVLGQPPVFDTAAALLEAADTALYRAKRGGRNCVSFFEESPQQLLPGKKSP
jgi:two-component system, cell cycle response regulator